MHDTYLSSFSTLFTAIVVLATGTDPQLDRAPTVAAAPAAYSNASSTRPDGSFGTGSAPTATSNTGSSNKAAPKWEPLITPEEMEEIQRQFEPGGAQNPLWNPDIQENVYRQLKADGVFETPRTPWYVPFRKVATAIFAFGLLISALRARRAAKKSETESPAAVAGGKALGVRR